MTVFFNLQSSHFFSYENSQIKETGRTWNTKWSHDSAKQGVSSRFNVGRNWLRVICGHSWFFKRLLSNKFLLHRMDLKAQRILNQQTHCHLFISDWKNIVLPGVTLSFKQLKRRKVSLLYMWLVVSINTALMSLAS